MVGKLFLRTLSIACLSSMLLSGAVAVAQTGPMELVAVVGKKLKVPSWTDAERQQKGADIAVTELSLPLRVFEETPDGMFRVAIGGQQLWVSDSDFRARRGVKAECNVALQRITTGADRGANEGCPVVKK